MATVLFARSVPTKKRIQLGVREDGVEMTFTVTEATYLALGSPFHGTEISHADLGTVRFEDEYLRALKKAMSYLSLSDKSRVELRMKLVRQGFSYEASDMALDRLSELSYLDEDRQLERAIEREANNNLRGYYYIKRKLCSKGYSSAAVRRAADRLIERGDVDFDANLERLLEKKGVTSDEERVALEYRFGYKI